MTAGRSVVFDDIADRYDDTRGGPRRGREIAAALDRVLPAGRLVEVGIGTGLVAAGLAELGRPVVGFDLSVPMLRYAAARLPGRVAVGDAMRLPVPSGAVDGAYLVHVLHLVGDVGATLDELHRTLRPGGVLSVTVRPTPRGADTDLHQLMHRLQSGFRLPERPDREDLVVAAAERHGFEPAERIEVHRDHLLMTPREVAARIEDRSWSWMWAIPDDAWRAAIMPVLADLRALPDQDRPRPGNELVPVLAFRRR